MKRFDPLSWQRPVRFLREIAFRCAAFSLVCVVLLTGCSSTPAAVPTERELPSGIESSQPPAARTLASVPVTNGKLRQWQPRTYRYVTTNITHGPVYFEHKSLERQGGRGDYEFDKRDIYQPMLSSIRAFAEVWTFPIHFFRDPPWTEIQDTGLAEGYESDEYVDIAIVEDPNLLETIIYSTAWLVIFLI